MLENGRKTFRTCKKTTLTRGTSWCHFWKIMKQFAARYPLCVSLKLPKSTAIDSLDHRFLIKVTIIAIMIQGWFQRNFLLNQSRFNWHEVSFRLITIKNDRCEILLSNFRKEIILGIHTFDRYGTPEDGKEGRLFNYHERLQNVRAHTIIVSLSALCISLHA